LASRDQLYQTRQLSTGLHPGSDHEDVCLCSAKLRPSFLELNIILIHRKRAKSFSSEVEHSAAAVHQAKANAAQAAGARRPAPTLNCLFHPLPL
jgi:hypothetical protein